MNRDKSLVARRVKLVGLFLKLKEFRGESRKKSVLEVSDLLLISKDTVLKDFKSFKKRIGIDDQSLL